MEIIKLNFFYNKSFEPKVKTSKNTFIGLRIGTALNSQGIVTSDPNQFYINNDASTFQNLAISFVPTCDYYFLKNKFRAE